MKFAAINTLPPVGKQKRYSPQVLTYIHALKENPPPGREPIDWKLVTNLPVEDLSVAVEKLGWYALRWKAEVFHKVMKSGCRAEEGEARDRREAGEVPRPHRGGQLAHVRRHYVGARQARRRARQRSHLRRDHCARPDRRVSNATAPPTAHASRLPAANRPMVGGYLARNHDPPPGNMVVWRGMTRLHDIAFGISIGSSR
ncbi:MULTISPECIES: hypothetical protein [unclassified Mesorhizobium]|uniref:hypothetical protein n=1 Tax=unclassified Mesorhizobium TaxID=325217 RepID=UPI001936FA9C|nr:MULTISPECIES: hypothetical protein [unclassified Mesorhizobium]BCG97423.1 hypothetical protein MesoLj131a_62870 [Mesorhizobium sp. 131-2-1]BCH04494.1 hypothetical protein MesoLj131b_64930 [Mesorhizobium sp. 131-2-5]